MKLRHLLLYIGFAILGFWLLGFAIKLAGWVLNVVLLIGLILVILSLVNQYYGAKSNKK